MSSGAVQFSEERIEAFPTRIFRRQFEGLDALNARLASIILEKEASGADSLRRSNVGGWHSENDFMRWGNPEIEVIRNLVHSALMDYVAAEIQRPAQSFELTCALEAWANVVRAGNYAKPHVHPMSNFALVYYVDAGDHQTRDEYDLSGTLEFIDPRNRPHLVASPAVDGRDGLASRPKSGTLLIFPSWMYHYVHPYQGQRPRISVAINALVQQLTPKEPTAVHARPKTKIVEGD